MSEKNDEAKKSAGNNQWVTSHQKSKPDKRERKDGPGGS